VDLEPMPRVMRNIQYAYDSYPPEYLRLGLSELLNVPTLEDAYRRFVFRFVDVLVKALRESPPALKQTLPPFEQIDSAFHDPVTGYREKDPAAPPGRRIAAYFAYVAARRDELEGLRASLEAYGDEGGFDWRPYLPTDDTEIAITAALVASKEGFFYEKVKLSSGLVEEISDLADANQLVVVLVDPWSILRVGFYGHLMRKLDRLSSTSSVIVVLVNESDYETARSRLDLEDAVREIFANRMEVPDPVAFAPWIGTAGDLEQQLAAKLTGAKLRVLKRRNVRPAGASNGGGSVPTIGL